MMRWFRPVLFDTFTTAKDGGTGIAFDWGLIDSLPVSLPLILAGGLGPDNIARPSMPCGPMRWISIPGLKVNPAARIIRCFFG